MLSPVGVAPQPPWVAATFRICLLPKGRFRLFCPLPAPPALTLSRMCAFTLPALMLSRMCAFTLPALMLRAGADGVLSASGCGKAAHRHTL